MDLLNTSPIELLRSGSRWNWLYHAHLPPNTHIWTQIWEDPCPAHIIYHTWTYKHVLQSASNSFVLMSLHSHIWKWVKQHFYFEAFLTFLMMPWITRHICSVFQPYQGCRRYHVSRLLRVRPNYKLETDFFSFFFFFFRPKFLIGNLSLKLAHWVQVSFSARDLLDASFLMALSKLARRTTVCQL